MEAVWPSGGLWRAADDVHNPVLSAVVNVLIHASQFPEAIRRDLLESLRRRQVNHKFHYDSVKQVQKWLALHQAHAPSRQDADCAATYDRGFASAVAHLPAPRVHVVGLGCGGGQKDTRLLRLLRDAGKEVCYTPCDVSVAMTLVARETALAVVRAANVFPFVCDLALMEDLPEAMARLGPPDATRLITFFGMIPNFEPGVILPKLSSVVRPGDALLLSANLVPGPDFAAGVRHILPQYDNPLTRDWLLTFLFDLGVARDDGELVFCVEDDPGGSGLKRVVARFQFTGARSLTVAGESFAFQPGDTVRLFFSYRHTVAQAAALLRRHGLQVLAAWVTNSEEEGVFLVEPRAGSTGRR